LHQNVEPFAVLFNRTPQILQPAIDVEEDVVEMPAASIPALVSLDLASRAAATELITASAHTTPACVAGVAYLERRTAAAGRGISHHLLVVMPSRWTAASPPASVGFPEDRRTVWGRTETITR